jgi:DEAD/DEAH box helicase domain-containing protein
VTLVERPTLSSLLDDLVDDGRIVHVEAMVERAARHAELARPLPAHLGAALGELRLWSHQASAIDLARSGRSVVVATGTASGKSLC